MEAKGAAAGAMEKVGVAASMKSFVEWGGRHASFAIMLGGAAVGIAAMTLYVGSIKEDVRMARVEAQRDVQAARLEAQAARLEAQAARVEAQRDVETARRETADKFLMYGFTEEYQAYQRLLKLPARLAANEGDKTKR